MMDLKTRLFIKQQLKKDKGTDYLLNRKSNAVFNSKLSHYILLS